jgi:hypothetical protein
MNACSRLDLVFRALSRSVEQERALAARRLVEQEGPRACVVRRRMSRNVKRMVPAGVVSTWCGHAAGTSIVYRPWSNRTVGDDHQILDDQFLMM